MTDTVTILKALRDAIDGFKDCAQYKGDYLRKKHGDDEEIAALEAVYSKALSEADEQPSTYDRCLNG